ncbi:calcium-binding protein [Hydrogenovibrio kuenenii]|uniref:calcium-binding protein n=1 Tax=Hydrogenovibrio kuenenii TaxID=63658 RepID=UPI0004670A5F|nr:calcium-binding protein [Hydrogenovibrio kuenenii]
MGAGAAGVWATGVLAGVLYSELLGDDAKKAINDALAEPIPTGGDPTGGDPTGGDPTGGDPGKCPFPSPPPLPTPPAAPASPLVLDLDGDGVETVGLDANIHFDHAGDGFNELSGFVGADDGLLVWDRNGDGEINSGSELFGNETVLGDGTKADNGFLALADLDSNGDGVFDVNDDKFSALRVFQDKNQNGQADDGELITLSDAGVQSISLGYNSSSSVDENGNEHRQIGSFTTTAGETHSVEDVWFTRDLTNSVEETVAVSDEIAELPDAMNFGTAHSLHQAMAIDETGKLQQLVQQFVDATTSEERHSLIDPIIFAWTNQGDEYSQYYQSPIDARKIGALEAFYGHDLDTPNGSGQDFATLYEGIYQDLSDTIFYQLSANSYLKPVFSDVTWTQNEAGEWEGDFSKAVSDLLEYAKNNPNQGEAYVSDFAEAVRGVNPYSEMNSKILDQTLRHYLPIIDALKALSAYSQSTIDIITSGILGATSEDDVVYGDDSGSTLYALAGDDSIYGSNADDVFVGGKGNDYLKGGNGLSTGSDSYHFSVGDGQDTINDRDYYNEDTDAIYIHGVTSDQLSFTSNSDGDLLIGYSDSDQIKIQNFMGSPEYQIEKLVLDDGTELNVDDMVAQATTGTDADETIYGSYKGDVFVGGKGNDYFNSDSFTSGSDSYHFSVGDGQDTINDRDYYNEDTDAIYIHGVTSDQLSFTSNSDGDLLIGYSDSDQIKIQNFMGSPEYQIEKLVLDDGTELNVDDMVAQATTGTDADETIYGSYKGDVFVGGKGNDYFNSDSFTSGSDSYHFSVGDGQDTIDEYDYYSGYTDTVYLHGVTSDQVSFTSNSSGDLLIGYGESDQVKVLNFMESSRNQIEKLVLDDGTEFNADELVACAILGSTDGNDTIIGTSDDNLIIGRKGNDRMVGGTGNDTYEFNVGDGQDAINDNSSVTGEVDKILLHGVAKEDVAFTTNNWGDLLVHYGDSDQIIIENSLESERYQIEQIVFDDGSVISADEATAQAMIGTDIDESIYGTGKDDVIIGGKGNDRMVGGTGNDTYEFNVGDGQDAINDNSSVTGEVDKILLHGVAKEDVAFTTNNWGDLLVHYGDSDQIIIENSLESERYQIEQIVFDDGSVISADEATAQAMIGTDIDESIYGTGKDDVIIGGKGNDRMVGGTGNDTYEFNVGDGQDAINDNSSVTGEVDQILLHGVAKEDVAFTTNNWGDLLVHYGDSDQIIIENSLESERYQIEQIVFDDGSSYTSEEFEALAMTGTDSDETIYGSFKDDVITGGKGNDLLKGGASNDSYHFNVGDGQDQILDYSFGYTQGGVDSIYLHGVTKDDVSFSTTDGRVVVHYGTNDSISIQDQLNYDRNKVENIVFDDGSSYTSEEFEALAMTGTDSDETIYGSFKDDVITGGKGNDLLKGGAGNDSYHFNVGDGQDQILDYSFDSTQGGTDSIDLHGVSKEGLWFSKNGDDMKINLIGTSDSITVNDWYYSDRNKIESINLDSGESLDVSGVSQLVDALASFPEGGDSAVNMTDDEKTQFNQIVASNWKMTA